MKILKIILAIFVLGLLIDLGILNWRVFRGEGPRQFPSVFPTVSPQEKSGAPFSSPQTTLTPQGCPAPCLSQIYEATASLKFPAPVAQTNVTQVGSQVKEFFVTLGSGSSRANDWEDTTGLATYIDSTKYGRIKNVAFEATVYIPNGNQGVYVRLFNATDKHPVWFSEVYHEGGAPKLLISQPITLDPGNKLYQVQMKTTLKDLANLNQARVKITTE